jgi:hypothetical protein
MIAVEKLRQTNPRVLGRVWKPDPKAGGKLAPTDQIIEFDAITQLPVRRGDQRVIRVQERK